ncbi:hypothetical protein GCM10007937_53690 [Mesorhizobium albiziae]|nr:hypothetical protein GCM10007937_53690 [Mesorhizobium albiziae]
MKGILRVHRERPLLKLYACGKASADALDVVLAIQARCEFIERDRYGRYVGDCYRAGGIAVVVWLVSHDFALDWPRYRKGPCSGSSYGSCRSTWHAAGQFVAPWEARGHRKDK